MATGNSILRHPDLEEIIEWMYDGVSVRDAAQRLLRKYGSGHKFCASWMTLQGFRKNYLEITKSDTLDFKKKQLASAKAGKEIDGKARVKLAVATMEKKHEAAMLDVDVIDEQMMLLTKIEDQLNLAITMGSSITDDNKKIRLFEAIGRLISENRQFLEGVHKRQADGTGTINIQNAHIEIKQVNNYVDSIKTAVVETFREDCPELLPKFLVNLSNNLSNLDVIEGEVINE